MLRVRFLTNTVLDAGERDLERDLERALDFDLERDLDLDTERIRMSASLPLRDAISAVSSHFGISGGTTGLSAGRPHGPTGSNSETSSLESPRCK